MGIAWPVTIPFGAENAESPVELLNTITSVIASGVIPNGVAKYIPITSEVSLASAMMANASGGPTGISKVSAIPCMSIDGGGRTR
jgi:hypothetical protein